MKLVTIETATKSALTVADVVETQMEYRKLEQKRTTDRFNLNCRDRKQSG